MSRSSIVVERDGAQQTIALTPTAIEQPATDAAGQPVLDANGDAQTQQVGFAGIRQEVEYVHQPIWAGPVAAVENVGAVAGIIWQLPVKVFETAVTLVTGRRARPERTRSASSAPASSPARSPPRRLRS